MGDRILKFKSFETALSQNVTVSNSITTISSGKIVRLYNSNLTTIMVATISSANVANLNQTFAYANVTIGPAQELYIYKAATDFVNGNAALLATSVANFG